MAKIKKKFIIFAILLIILIVPAIYFYQIKYNPIHKRVLEVQDYKKVFYNSVLCEYNCPLTLQDYKNQTQLLPDQNCVKSCTQELRVKESIMNVSSQELQSDNLINDMQKIILACRSGGYDSTTKTANNSFTLSCSEKELQLLKNKYSYL